MSRVIGNYALILTQPKLAGLKPQKGGETKVAGALLLEQKCILTCSVAMANVPRNGGRRVPGGAWS